MTFRFLCHAVPFVHLRYARFAAAHFPDTVIFPVIFCDFKRMFQRWATCVEFCAEAVPKRILDLMSVEGLTRENVASHLQVPPVVFLQGSVLGAIL